MKPIKYIIENKRDYLWGLTVTTIGYEKFSADTIYPSVEHGFGYFFSPKKGRVIQEYQLVYIPHGEGFLKTERAGEIHIKAGNVFLLFPNEWHTYYPSKKTGWTQYWIGFKGTNIDQRVKNGFLHAEKPLFQVGVNEEMMRLFEKAIQVAHEEKPYFQQMLAGIANYLLGLIYSLDGNTSFTDKRLENKINEARLMMREQIDSSISLQKIAEEIGMSYSLFRKLFKEYTGLSPAQYYQEIKIQRAKELLKLTSLSVKEIAYRLNFKDPDYFSAMFKKKTGKRPYEFRME